MGDQITMYIKKSIELSLIILTVCVNCLYHYVVYKIL